MKHIQTLYRPHFVVEFSKEEVAQLVKCSEHHYDGLCRSLSRWGGTIACMKLLSEDLDDTGTFHITLEWRDVDLLCKVLEQSTLHGYDGALFYSLHKLLADQGSVKEIADHERTK